MLLQAFDGEYLTNRLAKMDSWQQCAFGTICCERLVPNYVAFQKDAGSGDFEPLRSALNLAWSFLEGQEISVDEIKRKNIACEFVAPSSDDFKSLFVTAAQDACFAVCSLLDYLLDKDVSKIVQVARYATDSVDLYVQENQNMLPDDPDLEQKILAHPLMQRELGKQNADLESIERNAGHHGDFMAKLKGSWKNNDRGNLDVP